MKKKLVLPPSLPRCPVVTILGHVDHGKTTLLDTIRKTNVASKEAGGITQHIGAYQVTIQAKDEKSPRTITFIDTPGHEAFSKMRGRGVKVADIAILVVAANDGVMPQTIESIAHIKSAKIPCIVAINKIDLSGINIEKLKKQLTKAGLNLEEYGGETPVIPVSAKNGTGIEKLLEIILLLNELFQTKEDGNNFQAVVIEASLSKNRGPVATIIIRNGKIKVGQNLICDKQEFRIRALIDWQGKNLNEASSGQPIEVLGWKKVPEIGASVSIFGQVITPSTSSKNNIINKINIPIENKSNTETDELKLRLIIKTDSLGSLEAISHGLKDNVEIISNNVGQISESDVLLAKTTKAIIIGFHMEISENVRKLALSEKVLIKTFNIIYEVFQEIDEVADALRLGNLVTILGEAKIIAIFSANENQVAGVQVASGRIARGDQVKIMHGDKEIGRAKIKSLRHLKDDITRAEQGEQAGVILTQKVDFLTGDSIMSIG